ncbi:EVE domain-containing protein [uncultured Jatrophihabitans sp.]|uniref:EVE domain-containing protein n=1 Tax=uncultured Jatrophihabitans sp. TaxID=1610747 RepID=UPI0035CA1BBD
MASRTWVLVASLDHARRGVEAGYVMANHGKRAPLARMAVGDDVLIYSPTRSFPRGEPLRAITVVGAVTGTDVEPSEAIPGGFRRRAQLREIEPVPLARLGDHLPRAKLRFGCFELDEVSASAIRALIPPA